MTSLDTWRVLVRAWSVQIAAIGAAMMATLLALDTTSLQAAWQAMPPELRALLPEHVQTWVSLLLFVGVAIARAVPQSHVERRLGLLKAAPAGGEAWRAAANAPIARKIDGLVVHCAATPEGKPFFAADIRRWHKAKGWADIGYHFVVDLDGAIEVGRPLATAGAHVEGHNATTIGICYVGGVASDGKTPKDTRTGAQKAALLQLLGELAARYPGAIIRGHRDFPRVAKACPSFDARSEYAHIGRATSGSAIMTGPGLAIAAAMLLPLATLSACVDRPVSAGAAPVTGTIERVDAAYARIRGSAELVLPLLPPRTAARIEAAIALGDMARAAVVAARTSAERLRAMREVEAATSTIAAATSAD